MKENGTESKMQNTLNNKVEENELENVSGGLWGITLLDTCKGKFDENTCLHALFEPCSQLVFCGRSTSQVKDSTVDVYVYTCKKGCFKDLKLLKSITY